MECTPVLSTSVLLVKITESTEVLSTPKIVKITENTLAFTDHLVIFTIFGVLSTSVLSVIFTKSTEVLKY